MKQKLHLLLLFCCISVSSFAQELNVDLDFRDRFEYRHGFSSLFPDDGDHAAFVRQRARLNISYTSELLETAFSLQDISTWGDTRQILPNDYNNSLMIFQAWAALNMNEHWTVKVGRQPIVYDNERVFGGLDWAMQGRTHDAALLKYKTESFHMDLGFAFSQVGENTFGTEYDITGFFTYKTMQYVYLNKSFNNTTLSFLFLNNGYQAYEGENNDIPDGSYNTQTTGIYFKIPSSSWGFEGNAFYQFGKASQFRDLSAYDIKLDVTYKPGATLFAVGMELISGTDQDGESKSHSFFPLFGTNHKYNGFMDYFYVGNHANNVGLNDFNAKVVFKTGEKSNLMVKAHYFGSNAKLTGDADSYLGTEIDLVYNQTLFKFAKVSMGYSQMFASESMSLIKGGTPNDNTNNWAWVGLTVNPKLFTHTF